MEVVATTGQVAIYEDTVATSAPVILNGKCIIRIEPIDGNRYKNGVPAPDLPYNGAPYTSNPQWTIILVQNDRAIERLEMGKITNHLVDWTNDLTGAIQAATDLSVAFQSGGGGGGIVDSVGGGTTGYTFSGGANPVMSVSNAVTARNSIHAADPYPTLTFRTNTNTNADPGSGSFRLNNATIGSVTEMCVSELGHFETGDYFIIDWQLGWGGTLFLKDVASDDIMTIALGAITNTSFSKFPITVTTVVGGVAGDLPADNTVWRIVSVGGKADSVNTYVATLSQVTTGNITATVIQNTYGGTPVYARTGVGQYTITLAGAWTAGTVVEITNSVVSVGTDNRGFIDYRVADTDVIEVSCEDVDRLPQDIESANFSIRIQS